MRTVKTGQVERMIWWKGMETIALLELAGIYLGEGVEMEGAYTETFEIAMLIVKRNEKVMRIRLSRRERGVRVNVPP
jgi:hypothetical protein